jgi:hypothetical protein
MGTYPGGGAALSEYSDRVTHARERATCPGGGALDADFTETESDTYPPALTDTDQWMVRGGDLPPRGREKAPFAPWADDDGAKWGQESNRAAFDTARKWKEKDPRADGLAFIQTESDPFAFVDGDDVRDPDTGAVHPVFRALLAHLGATYTDVSTSRTGVHAYYLAPDGLPLEDKGQATFEIDTDPWGANDDAPTVEIYANTHVNVTTGEHVAGTPTDAREWDADAPRAIPEAHGHADCDPNAIGHAHGDVIANTGADGNRAAAARGADAGRGAAGGDDGGGCRFACSLVGSGRRRRSGPHSARGALAAKARLGLAI